MATPYYTASGEPQQGSAGSSSDMRAEFLLVEAGFAKLPTLAGNAGKMVVVNGGETALTVSALGIPTSGTLATLAGTETFTNHRVTARVGSLADGVAITPNADSVDETTHVNTQALGTLTVNAHAGTPTDGQRLTLRIKSTNAHALSFDAVYRGSIDLALPAALSGASKTDYLAFIWNAADSKWDLVAIVKGYT